MASRLLFFARRWARVLMVRQWRHNTLTTCGGLSQALIFNNSLFAQTSPVPNLSKPIGVNHFFIGPN